MVQSAGRRLSRVERVVVVVSVTLVAVLVVMLAVRLAGTSQPGGTAAASTTPPAATETETETGDAPVEDLAAVEWDFASPSGNIACDIDSDRAMCAITSMDYADQVPAAEEEACDGTVGHVLRVGAQGSSLVCDTTDEAGAFDADTLPVIEYGEQAEDEGFTCLSERTGMTCRHEQSGYSFSVARAGYDLT